MLLIKINKNATFTLTDKTSTWGTFHVSNKSPVLMSKVKPCTMVSTDPAYEGPFTAYRTPPENEGTKIHNATWK